MLFLPFWMPFKTAAVVEKAVRKLGLVDWLRARADSQEERLGMLVCGRRRRGIHNVSARTTSTKIRCCIYFVHEWNGSTGTLMAPSIAQR